MGVKSHVNRHLSKTSLVLLVAFREDRNKNRHLSTTLVLGEEWSLVNGHVV